MANVMNYLRVQKIDSTKVKTTSYSDSSIITLTMILVGRDFQCRKSEGNAGDIVKSCFFLRRLKSNNKRKVISN